MSGPGKGPARGYSWPPFEAGNTVAERSGWQSERRIAPIAEQLAGDLLASDACPPYLTADPTYRPAIEAWAHAEAQARLLRAYVDSFGDIADALAETTTTEETEDRPEKGRVRRMSTARRLTAAMDALHKVETRAASARARLGLDPVSRARLAADLGQARFWGGRTPLDVALDEMEAKRQAALEAATTGTETEAGQS